MSSGRRLVGDRLAAIAAVIALIMIGLYVGLIREQGGQVASWFLGGLAVAALLSLYGVAQAAPRRRLALSVSGVMLTLLGLAGILSIGLPILIAGVLALIAAFRAQRPYPRAGSAYSAGAAAPRRVGEEP